MGSLKFLIHESKSMYDPSSERSAFPGAMYCQKLGRVHHRWELVTRIPLDTSSMTSSFLASGIRWNGFKWGAAFPVWIGYIIFPVLNISAWLLAKTSEYLLKWEKAIASAHQLGYLPWPPGSPPALLYIYMSFSGQFGGWLMAMERLILSASVSRTLSSQWLQRSSIYM